MSAKTKQPRRETQAMHVHDFRRRVPAYEDRGEQPPLFLGWVKGPVVTIVESQRARVVEAKL